MTSQNNYNKKKLLSFSKLYPFFDEYLTNEKILQLLQNEKTPPQPSEAMVKGSVIHQKFLQKKNANQKNEIKVFSAHSLGFENFRKKEAKEKKEELQKKGWIQVSSAFTYSVDKSVDNLKELEQIFFKDFEKLSEVEVVGNFCEKKWTGHIDCIYTKRSQNILIDLKTCSNFEKTGMKMIEMAINQLALYSALFEQTFEEKVDEIDIMMVDTINPQICKIINIDEQVKFNKQEIDQKFFRALERYKKFKKLTKNLDASIEKFEKLVEKEKEEKEKILMDKSEMVDLFNLSNDVFVNSFF